MKRNKQPIARALFVISALFVSFFSLNPQILAQKQNNSEKEQLRPPAEEEFQAATDLVVPWRSGGCHFNFDFNEPNCYQLKAGEYQNSRILSLYNSDGSLWYRFSLRPGEKGYFLRDGNKDFLPFSTDAGFIKPETFPYMGRDPATAVILRMVAESKNWYEVEVNEETRATKFVLKSDPLWTKTTWSYWLFLGRNIYINTNVTRLYDKPDGEVIGDSPLMLGEKRFTVLKVEGDWLFGSMHTQLGEKAANGWIRWRKGRDILVGCVFTGEKLPDVKTDDEND